MDIVERGFGSVVSYLCLREVNSFLFFYSSVETRPGIMVRTWWFGVTVHSGVSGSEVRIGPQSGIDYQGPTSYWGRLGQKVRTDSKFPSSGVPGSVVWLVTLGSKIRVGPWSGRGHLNPDSWRGYGPIEGICIRSSRGGTCQWFGWGHLVFGTTGDTYVRGPDRCTDVEVRFGLPGSEVQKGYLDT